MTAIDVQAAPASAQILGAQDGVASPRTRFLGVSFDPLRLADAVTLIVERRAEAPFAPVVTPNAAHVVRIASEGGRVRAAYDNAWLCLNDSRVVDFLARSRGVSLPATPGSDLLVKLLSDPRFDRASPTLLVGGDDALFRALVEKAGLTAARHHAPPMGLLERPGAIEETASWIEAHPARYVLLAVGSPQQELIAEALRSRGIARGVGLCIGAGVEFLTGRRKRAPAWMSRFGLEWLFRLVSEPQRMWRRYLVDSPGIFRLYVRDLLSR